MRLWEERLNDDGQQFQHYQQNKQSHINNTMTYDVGNPVPGLGQAQK